MVIRPGLLMRSQEEQPCVERCFWTSPPPFLQCYCSPLIVPCASAVHRQSKTTLPFVEHHTPVSCLPPSLCLMSILSWSVCLWFVRSELHHSFTPTLLCSPVGLFALSSSGWWAAEFSSFTQFSRSDQRKHQYESDSLKEFLTDASETNEDRDNRFFLYFTHQPSHAARRGAGWAPWRAARDVQDSSATSPHHHTSLLCGWHTGCPPLLNWCRVATLRFGAFCEYVWTRCAHRADRSICPLMVPAFGFQPSFEISSTLQQRCLMCIFTPAVKCAGPRVWLLISL